MAYTFTDDGLDWFADRAVPGIDDELNTIAVGTDNTFPQSDDQQLGSRVYQAPTTYDNCSIDRSSNTGQINCSVTVTGGTHVTAGTSIIEIGVKTESDELVYREVRDGAITIDDGERVTIDFSFSITR
jgi:hypothetical protein